MLFGCQVVIPNCMHTNYHNQRAGTHCEHTPMQEHRSWLNAAERCCLANRWLMLLAMFGLWQEFSPMFPSRRTSWRHLAIGKKLVELKAMSSNIQQGNKMKVCFRHLMSPRAIREYAIKMSGPLKYIGILLKRTISQ